MISTANIGIILEIQSLQPIKFTFKNQVLGGIGKVRIELAAHIELIVEAVWLPGIGHGFSQEPEHELLIRTIGRYVSVHVTQTLLTHIF